MGQRVARRLLAGADAEAHAIGGIQARLSPGKERRPDEANERDDDPSDKLGGAHRSGDALDGTLQPAFGVALCEGWPGEGQGEE
ncbi:MAG: hypothetical protein MUE97_08020 [Phycisphaerales bacterium]|nr:hypothetical protein [Phycisphaerales bacterium]